MAQHRAMASDAQEEPTAGSAPSADWELRLAERVAGLPAGPGCYLYRDGDGVEIYVGKAKNLRRRVSSYFQRSRGHPVRTLRLVSEIRDLDWISTASEVEALLLENRLIKDLQPRFNIDLKDGKEYPLLAITREEFPRVFITRNPGTDADLIGPFISAGELRRAYHVLMRVFQFRVCDLDIRSDDPRRRSFRPCLNYHIKRCSAPCTPRIDSATYGEDIRSLRAFLSGRGVRAVSDGLKERMASASAALRYEDAARYRDQLQALGSLGDRGRIRAWATPPAPVITPAAALDGLARHLGLDRQPRIIDGFDNAHLMGTNVVAAAVRFVDGQPHKDGYRRFRVRGPDGQGAGNDDYAAMHEVVGRRYRRARDEGEVLPDLLLIDGGPGQVAKAVEALAAVGVVLPLVGLAKEEELVVRTDGSTLRLSRRDPALKLLQHVRDEAHRFSRRYLHLLQKKDLQR
jgi:excinuclease ABC subunit C